MSVMNNNKLLAVIALALALGGFAWWQSQQLGQKSTAVNTASAATDKGLPLSFSDLAANSEDPSPASENTTALAGIQPVSPEALIPLLGAYANKPVVIDFSSEFCLDCQRIAPLLNALSNQYPGVTVLALDVVKDRKSTQWAPLFNALAPNTTPTVVFIKTDRTISQSMVGYQAKDKLDEAFKNILNNGH